MDVATRERSDPLCLPADTAATLLADAPWRRFAVIGDSLSAGVGDAAPGYDDLGWADRVVGALRAAHPDVDHLNVAVVGARTPEILRDQAATMEEFAPDLVHLPCGANDLVRRAPDFDRIERDLSVLFDRAARTGAHLLTFTLGRAYQVPAFADWDERVRRMNAITRRVAADHGAAVVDMYDHPVNHRADLLSADRIHFATSGQAVLGAEVVRCLARHLRDPHRTRS